MTLARTTLAAVLVGFSFACHPSSDGGGPPFDVDPVAPDGGVSDDGIYFPPPGGAWESVHAASGWDAAGLAAVADFAHQHNSTALLILDRGRIVAEHYWVDPLSGARWDTLTAASIYSAGKSVVAMLLGEAVHEGLVTVDTPVSDVLGPGWSGASAGAERAILVRHLASMTSGLTATARLREAAPAGTEWLYNTDAYYKLIVLLEAATGKSRTELLRAKIAGPIGMDHAQWSGERIVWSARDMARFGLLVMARGAWAGIPVLHDSAFLEQALRPSQALNPAYGFLWWLNGQSSFLLPNGSSGSGALIPAAPADMVAALGAGDKKIYVCPKEGWVVVRHGAPAGGDQLALSSFDNQLWEKIMAAAPRL